jgi:Arc/MetJ-type ribon-helix-helix transcriptional regulator
MSTITVELTGSERVFVEEQVARGKSPSPSAYINDLIRRQRFRDEEMPDDDITDEELAADMRARGAKAKARDPVAFEQAVKKVHELIREGIESGPAVEMTEADWDSIRKNVRDRLAKPEHP